MKEEFIKQKVKITEVYFCPHHPEKGNNQYKMNCECRKPKPGMIFKAKTDHNIDLKHSIFIGDKISDIQAAKAAGIENRILINSQYKDNNEVVANRVADLASAKVFID